MHLADYITLFQAANVLVDVFPDWLPTSIPTESCSQCLGAAFVLRDLKDIALGEKVDNKRNSSSLQCLSHAR